MSGAVSDLVARLHHDGEAERQYVREARVVLGSLLAEAATEIERLRASADAVMRDRALIMAERDRMRLALEWLDA